MSAAVSQVAALVLRCPECGAPQPGTVPVCKFCQVPLMWAPTRSLSRDDGHDFEMEDEPNTELLPFSAHLKSGASVVIQKMPPILCRPTFLWLHPKTASHVEVSNIHIGRDAIGIMGDERAPGLLYARGRGMPLTNANSISPGVFMSLTLSNTSLQAAVMGVSGAFRVRVLPKDGRGFTSDGAVIRGAPGGAWLDRRFGGR